MSASGVPSVILCLQTLPKDTIRQMTLCSQIRIR